MANTPFKSPYRENITDERALNLSAKTEGDKRANWTVRYAGNKVRLVIWTGIPNDVENGKMSLVIEINQWYAFLSLLNHYIENVKEPNTASKMVIKTLGPKGWKEGPIPRGDIYVGRNGEGVLFIALMQPNRPKIPFLLENDAFYNFQTKDGQPLDKLTVSNIVARSYVRINEEIIAALSATEYVSKEDRPSGPNRNQNNNSGNSGYNNQNQQSQPQQSIDNSFASSSDDAFSDDISF